jgi:hypothetical protein
MDAPAPAAEPDASETSRRRGPLARAAFAVVTASLLLAEIALTRVFSGTIGYYFAFMSISVAMLGLGAGSLWVTLRGPVPVPPYVRSAHAAFGMAVLGAASILAYLRYYPAMGGEGASGQAAYVAIFAALFVPFLLGGVVISIVLEANRAEFGSFYAVDLIGAAAGCVLAVVLLDHVAAPSAMLVLSAFGGLAAPLFLLAAGERRQAAWHAAALAATFGATALLVRGSPLLSPSVIRNKLMPDMVLDQWNDFSRVVVRKGPFYTWGLSETFPEKREEQYDLLIEGVAGTQIQRFGDRDLRRLGFLRYDVGSLPHLVRPTGSVLALGVGGGLDVLTARYFGKDRIVGVEVNPLVGKVVNEDFGDYSGRPYELPGVRVHFENARTFVKRDRARYDVVTVTWVDSGAATGAGAFALTENYLYTVEAFRDYLARLEDDGVLAFMRARYSPEYDAIKGIGIAVEALGQLGVRDPADNILVTSVKSPHFGHREITHVMLKKRPFSASEIAVVDEARRRLRFTDLYTPGRDDGDGPITELIRNRDRRAVYASFPFDMEPNTDDRPFYFFLRADKGRPAGPDVKILVQSIVTIFVLIGAFLVVPLVALLRRGVRARGGIVAPSVYFALLGLGFMLVEMKLLQQSVLVVGNPTLSLAAVLSSLLLSTGVGAALSERVKRSARSRTLAGWLFGALVVVLLAALVASEALADWLTGFPIAMRTAGLVVAIAPLGLLLGCPLPLGMSTLCDEREAPGLVPWCWGINGLFGVAGSAVAIYVAIHHGLKRAFLLGVLCYVAAAALLLVRMARRGTNGPAGRAANRGTA